MARLRAGDMAEGQHGQTNEHRGAEVRFLEDGQADEDEHDDGRPDLFPLAQAGGELGEVAGERDDEHELGDLAGLETQTQREGVPGFRAMDAVAHHVDAEQEQEADSIEEEGAVVEAGEGKAGRHGHEDQAEKYEKRFLLQVNQHAGMGAGGDRNAGAEDHGNADGHQQEGGHEDPQVPACGLVFRHSGLRQVHWLAHAHRVRSNCATASLKTRPRADMFTNMS